MKTGLQSARHQQFALALALVGVVFLAGCGLLPERGSYEVDFDGAPERTTDRFQMHGEVEIDSTTATERNFSDVSIVLYDQNESLIGRVPVGTLSTTPEHYPVGSSVNITDDHPPTYILIESPNFWNGDVAVTAYRWTGNQYEEAHIESEAELFES